MGLPPSSANDQSEKVAAVLESRGRKVQTARFLIIPPLILKMGLYDICVTL